MYFFKSIATQFFIHVFFWLCLNIKIIDKDLIIRVRQMIWVVINIYFNLNFYADLEFE